MRASATCALSFPRLTAAAAGVAARSRPCLAGALPLPPVFLRSRPAAAVASRGLAAGAFAAMNATEKYIFDLNGYIIIPQARRGNAKASERARQ